MPFWRRTCMIKIMLTRPMGRELGIFQAVAEMNHLHVENWPMQQLLPKRLSGEAISYLYDLDLYNAVFVASPTAAEYLIEQIDMRWVQVPQGVQFVCPGEATAKVLKQIEIEAIYPDTVLTSEAVCALPIFANVQQQRWLIASGDSGRSNVADFLSSSQARVDKIDMYTREANHQIPATMSDMHYRLSPRNLICSWPVNYCPI